MIMEMASATIPDSAVIAASFVLIYSFLCLSCGVLLVLVLFLTKERYSYVILFAVSTTCSTVVNIIQQINYLANWHRLRVEQYEASLAAYDNPSLALGPLCKGFNEALFWIVLYFYNVDSMLMLFWSVALVVSVWNWKASQLHGHGYWLGLTSKVAAWVLPAIVVGLRKSYQFHLNFVAAVILLNILMLLTFTIGTICLVLILTKYLKGRLAMSNYGSAYSGGGTQSSQHSSSWSRLKMRVDPWLVVRFTVAFIVLSALEVFLVIFEIRRHHKIQKDAKVDKPDFSAGATIADILNYIPGVTASLLAFLLFGTTAPLRSMYVSMIASINPFRRPRPQSGRIEPGSSQDWSRVTEDVELSEGRSVIRKGMSVDITVMDRCMTSDNEFDSQVRVHSGQWYPGRKIGIIDDP